MEDTNRTSESEFDHNLLDEFLDVETKRGWVPEEVRLLRILLGDIVITVAIIVATIALGLLLG